MYWCPKCQKRSVQPYIDGSFFCPDCKWNSAKEPPLVKCPECGSTNISAGVQVKGIDDYRQYEDGFPEEPHETYIDPTGDPVGFMCFNRECSHKWADPKGRSDLQQIMKDLLQETLEGR